MGLTYLLLLGLSTFTLAQKMPCKEPEMDMCIEALMGIQSHFSLNMSRIAMPACFRGIEFKKETLDSFSECYWANDGKIDKMFLDKNTDKKLIMGEMIAVSQCCLESENLLTDEKMDISKVKNNLQNMIGDEALKTTYIEFYEECFDNLKGKPMSPGQRHVFTFMCTQKKINDYCYENDLTMGSIATQMVLMSMETTNSTCKNVNVINKVFPIARDIIVAMMKQNVPPPMFMMNKKSSRSKGDGSKFGFIVAKVLKALGIVRKGEDCKYNIDFQVLKAFINYLPGWEGNQKERKEIGVAIDECGTKVSQMTIDSALIARDFTWLPLMPVPWYQLYYFNNCFYKKMINICGVENQLGLIFAPILHYILPDDTKAQIMGFDDDKDFKDTFLERFPTGAFPTS